MAWTVDRGAPGILRDPLRALRRHRRVQPLHGFTGGLVTAFAHHAVEALQHRVELPCQAARDERGVIERGVDIDAATRLDEAQRIRIRLRIERIGGELGKPELASRIVRSPRGKHEPDVDDRHRAEGCEHHVQTIREPVAPDLDERILYSRENEWGVCGGRIFGVAGALLAEGRHQRAARVGLRPCRDGAARSSPHRDPVRGRSDRAPGLGSSHEARRAARSRRLGGRLRPRLRARRRGRRRDRAPRRIDRSRDSQRARTGPSRTTNLYGSGRASHLRVRRPGWSRAARPRSRASSRYQPRARASRRRR